MTFWMVRAGRHGEEEQEALDNNLVTIGWNKIQKLGNINDKGSLKKIYSDTYPNKTPIHVARVVGQIWDFIKEIKKGDLIGNIIDEIMEHYENFNDKLKAELPLKRIWTLVSEESN
jgi:predicted Mrr-cat superfamily restriction endonuclease